MNIVMNVVLLIPFAFGFLILYLRFGGKIGSIEFAEENRESFWVADLFAMVFIVGSAIPWIIQLFGGLSFSDAANNVGGTLPFLGIMAQQGCGLALGIPAAIFGVMGWGDPKPGLKLTYGLVALILLALSLGIFINSG